MPSQRLAIPMQENPARQKLWRAVGFVTLTACAVILGYIIDRAIHYRTSPQRWPAEANLELRLIKTPRISKLVNEGLNDVQALPGAPWSLSDVLNWSKREVVLYADDDNIVGLVIDGQLSAENIRDLSNWGWTTMAVGHRTLIIPAGAAEPGPVERHMNLWLTLPIFDGSVTTKNQLDETQNLPFRFASATSLDFPLSATAFIPTTSLALPVDTELLGSFRVPASLSSAFLPQNVPANLPGLQTLSHFAQGQAIDVLIGQDEQGPAMLFALASPNMSLEELGSIAHEGASLHALSTAALTIDGFPDSQEIRSTEGINTKLTNTDGLMAAIAEGGDANVFRLTQSASQLIVSNREPFIGLESATYSGSCVRKPKAFLQPKALAATIPNLSNLPARSLFDHLRAADEIAIRKNWLRICW